MKKKVIKWEKIRKNMRILNLKREEVSKRRIGRKVRKRKKGQCMRKIDRRYY